ncbi:MAG: histidine phosphotransferase family protein [Pseudomonadota bacterium]|nr:histidine phosphotransferase family protein [Pseudomonadota bacterium]
MSAETTIDPMELAALVSSRICHDIISPVGAIVNGLEVLAEEQDGAMREHAMDLIRKSATQASAKLQFARLAFGSAGSAGASIDLGDAEAVSRALLDPEKHTLEWSGPRAAMPKDKVKLLLNMVTMAIGTLPRGGKISLTITGEVERPSFELRCSGEKAKISDRLRDALTGAGGLDAHSIQPFFASRLSDAAGMALEASMDGESVVLKAAPHN